MPHTHRNNNNERQQLDGNNDDDDNDIEDDAVTSPNDVLHLNIGGTKATTLRKTLTSIEDSLLAIKFSGRWDDGMEKDNEGNFLIDQEYFLFIHILNYLRNKSNGTEKYCMQSPDIEKRNGDLYRMVDYYGLTNGLYPSKLNHKHMLNHSSRAPATHQVVGSEKYIREIIYSRLDVRKQTSKQQERSRVLE